MAQPAFSNVLDWKTNITALSGSPININLFDANDPDGRIYKVRAQWVIRNSADIGAGRTGEQVAIIAGNSSTPSILGQGAAFTAVGVAAGGTTTFTASGTTIRFTFSNDANVTGEIMLSWRLEY